MTIFVKILAKITSTYCIPSKPNNDHLRTSWVSWASQRVFDLVCAVPSCCCCCCWRVVSGRAVLSWVSKEASGEIRFQRPVSTDEVPPNGLHTPPAAHAGRRETRWDRHTPAGRERARETERRGKGGILVLDCSVGFWLVQKSYYGTTLVQNCPQWHLIGSKQWRVIDGGLWLAGQRDRESKELPQFMNDTIHPHSLLLSIFSSLHSSS